MLGSEEGDFEEGSVPKELSLEEKCAQEDDGVILFVGDEDEEEDRRAGVEGLAFSEEQWQIDGFNVSPAEPLGHCCASFWCSACYVAGCFCGGRVNHCGVLTILISSAIGLVLMVLFGVLDAISLVVIGLSQGGIDTAGSLVVVEVFHLILGVSLLIWGLVQKDRIRKWNDPNVKPQLTDFDCLCTVILGCAYLAHAAVEFFGSLALVVLPPGLLALIALVIFTAVRLISSGTITFAYLYWAWVLYGKLGKIDTHQDVEINRTLLMNLDDSSHVRII